MCQSRESWRCPTSWLVGGFSGPLTILEYCWGLFGGGGKLLRGIRQPLDLAEGSHLSLLLANFLPNRKNIKQVGIHSFKVSQKQTHKNR